MLFRHVPRPHRHPIPAHRRYVCHFSLLSTAPHSLLRTSNSDICRYTNTSPVWVKCGICSADSLINICLCMLGFLPGLLHAWYIIAKFPENDYEHVPQDTESHRVQYVVIRGPDGNQHRVPRDNTRQSQGYGTTAPMINPPVNQAPNGTWNNNPAPVQGNSSGEAPVPPSYADAVKGDNKVQTHH